jgi:peptide deformylase
MKLTKRVLNRKAKPVTFQYPERNRIISEHLFDFMHKQNGIGLAAPQVGMSQRVFVMLVHGVRRACFNPEVLQQSDVLADFDEGCLSFPGDQCTINRPDWVRVRYQDPSGAVTEDTLVALEARCFQHELDHLDGVTMWDRHKEQHAEQP